MSFKNEIILVSRDADILVLLQKWLLNFYDLTVADPDTEKEKILATLCDVVIVDVGSKADCHKFDLKLIEELYDLDPTQEIIVLVDEPDKVPLPQRETIHLLKKSDQEDPWLELIEQALKP